jgi:hypothetical protein
MLGRLPHRPSLLVPRDFSIIFSSDLAVDKSEVDSISALLASQTCESNADRLTLVIVASCEADETQARSFQQILKWVFVPEQYEKRRIDVKYIQRD